MMKKNLSAKPVMSEKQFRKFLKPFHSIFCQILFLFHFLLRYPVESQSKF